MPLVPAPAERTAVRLGERLGQPVFVSVLQPGVEAEVARTAMSLLTGPTGTTLDDFLEQLEGLDLYPEFFGCFRSQESGPPDTPGAIFRGARPPVIADAPDDFSVVAVIAAYNEEDVIVETVSHLIANGVGVYLIDNWSTDATLDRVMTFDGAGLVGHERFPPEGPSTSFELSRLLARVEEVAESLETDWIVLNDADEKRCAPWSGVTLRDALYHVHQSGYTAVNHLCLNFELTQDTYRPGSTLEEHFTWFRPEREDMSRLNAWARVPGFRAELAWSGGHTVRFQGLRVFPYNFLLRHYPIRSVEQGRRKIFQERLPRFPLDERLRGWHSHYDYVRPDTLIRPTQGLFRFDERFEQDFVAERLTGVGFDMQIRATSVRLHVARALRRAGLDQLVLRWWWRLRGRAAKARR